MNGTDLYEMGVAEGRRQAAADAREFGRRTAIRLAHAAEQYTDPEILEALAKQRHDIAWAIEGAANAAAGSTPERIAARARQLAESRT
jgi:hypothetical protein